MDPQVPIANATANAPSAWEVIDASRRLHRRMESRLDGALEELGISYAQFEILELLTRDRNAHAAALARRLQVSRQITSRLLAKLDRGGLVELLPPDGGVRVPIVTRTGRRRIQLAADAMSPIRRQVRTLSAERLVQFVGTVEDLDAALRPPRRQWWFD
ncbi:MAG: MarR family transcriptional regulator, partial [Actinomycetota bacterium]